jgi:hypothetical protein
VDRWFFDSCLTESFWRGVVDGFSPHKFILTECKPRRLRDKDGSVYQAWIEVGELLTNSMTDYHYAEVSKTTDPVNPASVRRSSKEFASSN